MIAQKNLVRLDNSSVKLDITISQSYLEAEYNAKLKEYTSKLAIPGFRVGHIPVSVIKRKFNDALLQEVKSEAIEATFLEAIKDEADKPLHYSNPHLQADSEFKIENAFSYTIYYDIFPTLIISEPETFAFEIPEVVITKEDEEKALSYIQQHNAMIVERDSTDSIRNGDIVTADMSLIEIPNTSQKNSKFKDFTFKVGAGQNPFPIDQDIIGMKAGEEKNIHTTNPEESYTITVKKVKESRLPDLDDNFAQDISEDYKTLEDLKNAIREDLDKKLTKEKKQLVEKNVLEQLFSWTKTSLPKSMIYQENLAKLKKMEEQLGYAKDSFEKSLEAAGKSRQELFNEWEEETTKQITIHLALNQLLAGKKIECKDDEVYARINSYYQKQKDFTPAELEMEFKNSEYYDVAKNEVLIEKLLESLVHKATITYSNSISLMDALEKRKI